MINNSLNTSHFVYLEDEPPYTHHWNSYVPSPGAKDKNNSLSDRDVEWKVGWAKKGMKMEVGYTD